MHDSDYCSRRAAEARAAACRRDDSEDVEVAGQLALAYAALARSRRLAAERAVAGDPEPLMLRD